MLQIAIPKFCRYHRSTPIDSTSISLLINFLKHLNDSQSLVIVTSSDSFDMVSAFMASECQNILWNYQQAIEILKSKTSKQNMAGMVALF